MEEDKGKKDMHKTGWKNIELLPHLKKAWEEQERLNQEKRYKDAAEKDLKFMTAEEYMNQQADPLWRYQWLA